MDKNLNPPVTNIAAVEVLNLNEMGYGPGGGNTRKQWRAICLTKLRGTPYEFKEWQLSLNENLFSFEPPVNFGYICTHTSGWVDDSRDVLSNRCTLDFVGQHIDLEETYGDWGFYQHAWFVGATFNTDVHFKKAEFKGNARFGGAYFKKNAIFDNVIFEKGAGFRNTRFEANATFENARFEAYAGFDGAVIVWMASFYGASFSGDAWFDYALFKGDANFERTIFNEGAGFHTVTFEADAVFSKAKFLNQCRFEHCIFDGYIDFDNTFFESAGRFELARFTNFTPSFLGVALTARLEFSDEYYFPELIKTEDAEDAVKRLGMLKLLSDAHGQTDQALNFNAMELRAKRLQPNSHWAFNGVTWLYELISNYGRSFVRPILTYLILIFVTYALALFHAAYYSPRDCKGELWRVFSDFVDNGSPSCLSTELLDDKLKLNGYRAAFEYTSYRAAGVLDFSDADKQTLAVSKRLFNAEVEPWWMRFWGIFKAIASTALLFLAALGLRNKYRIK